MSYNFTVTKKEGKLTVDCPDAMLVHVPDGVFTISGHTNEDGGNDSVGINRRGLDGDMVSSAQSWHK